VPQPTAIIRYGLATISPAEKGRRRAEAGADRPLRRWGQVRARIADRLLRRRGWRRAWL